MNRSIWDLFIFNSEIFMSINRTTKSIWQFTFNAIIMLLPVIVPALVYYIVVDPYKVLRSYDNYFDDMTKKPFAVGVNKGMVTVRNYLARNKDGKRYNAFIFGSSISCYYDANEWMQLLGCDANAMHFDSSSESLHKMAEKIRFLDEQQNRIKYALIVLDPIVMNAHDSNDPPYIHPPEFHRGLIHWGKWHYVFFRAATNCDFFKSFIPSMLSGKSHSYGRNRIFELQPIAYNSEINQESIPQWDSLIANNKSKFYSIYPLVPAAKNITVSPVVLDAGKVEALNEIARIFARHGTDYQIIIGPNRRKVCLNCNDYATITRIFPSNRVHDYSVSQASMLDCDTLLYDNTHYRPVFASRLMRLTYKNRTKASTSRL